MYYWKQGCGTEFGGELIRYGFEYLGLHRIFATCAAINYGSYRVMERNRMRREALRRKVFWARVDKACIDRAEYSILAEDYFAEESPVIGRTASGTVTVIDSNTDNGCADETVGVRLP
jgi:RimJ/RimL family protein N-acetyltransferase